MVLMTMNEMSFSSGDVDEASPLRAGLAKAWAEALERDDQCAQATLRLIHTALRDRDLCAKREGRGQGVSDAELAGMLREMVVQRREEIAQCECRAQLELAEQEAHEIKVLERLLPPVMAQEELEHAVDAAIAETGASKLKDYARVMKSLKASHPGQIDCGRARQLLTKRLH
ncbi:MAG: GatB/YqeY domain-containing protein [Geminicoccaceae bacterium]